jgi:hypothetical protein
MTRPSVKLRLLKRLEPDLATGCLLWSGAQTGNGYGHMWADGHYRLTHRLAYELFVGPIADGLVIDHLCRQPLCANPRHLDAVTPATNTRRGELVTALKARGQARTHCPLGHEYTPENTYIRPDAARNCRTCIRERTARYRLRIAQRADLAS